MTALAAIVRGRVQGVGFRWFVWQKARVLGLSGGVRNHDDGSVEVIAEGPRCDLEALAELLKEGPLGAGVTRVDAECSQLSGNYKGFEIWASR